MRGVKMTTKTLQNAAHNIGDDAPTTRMFDVSAFNPAYWPRVVHANRQNIAETTPLNDVAICNDAVCEDGCNEQKDPAQDLIAVGSAPAGSPTERADVWQSDNGGADWVNIPGAAGHPFAAGEDIESVVCFQIDRVAKRWLVAREIVMAEPLKVAYSDDGGATWALVTVGSTNGEGAASGSSLFALDKDHIWLATTEGNVYRSQDGGLTWELQDSLTASGGQSLSAIKFANSQVGLAVGDSGTIILTGDGGETWEAITDPSGGANLLSLHIFSQFRFIVGDDADGLYQTFDQGLTWDTENFTGLVGTGSIVDMQFINDLIGYMVHNTVAPVGSVHRTINGGYSWEPVENVPASNAGLNAIAVANENLAIAVGNAMGGTSLIVKISG